VVLRDRDTNGEVDKDDETAFYADYGTANLRADLDEDGDVDADDQKLFVASFNKTTPGGRWKLSSEDVGNRKGYAGYEHEGFGNDLATTEIAHVRNRVLHFGLGRWTRRDPLGYVDGMNLYTYVASQCVTETDPSGLIAIASCDYVDLIKKLLAVPGLFHRLLPSLPHVYLPGGLHPENPYQHCVWNCRMTADRGWEFARQQSLYKEFIDVELCRLARAFIECDFWDRLPESTQRFLYQTCQSAGQDSDWWDNLQGRYCGQHGYYGQGSCEACCEYLGSGPRTPEGPGTDRPYSPCRLPYPYDPDDGAPADWWTTCPDPVEPDPPMKPGTI
jgi:RHS repeat-associated protein